MDVNTHHMYEGPSCETSGYHSSVDEQSGLLGYNTVSLHGKFTMLQKTLFLDCITLEGENTILHI